LLCLYVTVARFQYHVAVLTIVNGFENRLVPFVYPALSDGGGGSP